MAVEVHLVGGRLDGYRKPRESKLPERVWAQSEGDGSRMGVRFFRDARRGRALYRLDEEHRKAGHVVEQVFLFAQYKLVTCTGCDSWHELPAERCTLCGAKLNRSVRG